MTLKEKLDLWVKITGVNPAEERNGWTILLDGSLTDYDVKEMNDKITDSMQYDETGAFADAYLSIFFDEYISRKKVPLKNLIIDMEYWNYLEDLKLLYTALQERDSTGIIMDRMRKAMDFYKLEYDTMNVKDVMEIISSAKNCISKNLDLAQLQKGAYANDSFLVSRDIYMYRDISDVVRYVANGTINGVSMCYIKDMEFLEESYFAFVIKNGYNLYVLSDRPKYSHPAQKYIRRCPGRNMSNRIESNLFPYETISGIDISDMWNTGRYGLHESAESGAISNVFNEELGRVKLGTLNSLSQSEAFWTIYMFSLIKEKFYDSHTECNELSYTGCTVDHPALADTDKYKLVLSAGMPRLSLEAITEPADFALKYDQKPVLQFQYLAERYKDKVDNTVFNLVDGNSLKYIGNSSKREYLSLDLSGINTQTELEYNQKWVARYNMAVAIQKEVDKDFHENSTLVYNSVIKMIADNLREIVKKHLRNELIRKKVVYEGFEEIDSDQNVSFSKHLSFEQYYSGPRYHVWNKIRFNAGYTKDEYSCAFTGNKPGVVVSVNPRDIRDLEEMCGCSRDAFPYQLWHYTTSTRYTGNQILSNIDPFDWKLSDPYNGLDFSVDIYISFKEFLVLQKEAGVPVDAFWKNENPVCFNKSSEHPDLCPGKKKYSYENHGYKVLKKCLNCKLYCSDLHETE